MKTLLKNLRLLQVVIVMFPAVFFAQISGNEVYGNQAYRNNGYVPSNKKSIVVGTSDLIVSSTVMVNVKPDALIVTLGLNQEAKTVKECSKGINKRIDSFLQKIKTLGIQEDDIYVDFISQTRLYDYSVSDTKATQFENGFEIKKNIIVKLTDIKKFDALITVASKYEIYDIVKAEYIKEDTEEVNDMLLTEALKVAKRKKERHTKVFDVSLSKEPTTIEYNYYSTMPKNMYKEYRAFESSNVNIHNYNKSKNYIQKEQRKNHTFYYQGLDVSAFDKVINPSTPEVCLQYAVEVKLMYHIKR
ncbi:MAG: hypothetical protein BM557_03965 [Flavobacterium sp. MedPE-SWcel]|uniref:SIMPL domain-containing protein n=1 Tax=uncultured Flavobacterium sp. TaxID=165435 RepID=UPI000920B07C|nr:SIMPL domain-containing protein [uncultured Flavobacterium sp.]OIQ21417.1 MAG: hypothetical protein BM557_03965 [Flavobacterium sp. MedPE-SWcel]